MGRRAKIMVYRTYWMIMNMERLLTLDQICEILQVKKSTVYRWTFCKKIPHYKLNGILRFKEKEIGDWMDGRLEKVSE